MPSARHFVFIDLTYAYTADRPDTDEPLGGMTSAICFIARGLQKAGKAVTLVNLVPEERSALDIPSRPLAALSDICADPELAALVFCGRWNAELVGLLRQHTRAPFIAWMHESQFDTGSVQPLAAFDGFAFVSNWQRRVNEKALPQGAHTAILRNALHPCFASLFAPDEPILAAKSPTPILLYAGDFQRGAFHLPPIIDALRALDPDFTTEIYTNTRFSPDQASDERYFSSIAAMPNVSHIGKVGHRELAARMKRAALFIGPNPYPETACINLIQALASGMLAVITDRAALPETADSHARLVPVTDPDEPSAFNQPLNHKAFATACADALREWRSTDPATLEARLQAQRASFLDAYQWHQRIQPWIDFVQICT